MKYERETKRPNVIWIIADQLRAQSLGFNGDENLHTPCIDNLARSGTVFSSALSGNPWCTPFRGSMLTGLYPHINGCTQTPSRLNPEIPTIAHSFNAVGYHTAYVGKWHLSGSNSSTHIVPENERGGFAHWVGYENNNKQNDLYVHGSGLEGPVRLKEYETRSLSKLFISHLEEHAQQADPDPFFAVLSVQPPHSPYCPPDDRRSIPVSQVTFRKNVPHSKWVRTKAAGDVAGYSAMVEELDSMVAYIRRELKRLDLDRDTYILFFSDHGDMLGSHGQWEKSSPWEESIRIPMIISAIGAQEQIRVQQLDHPLNHVDIAPTTLGLCSIDVPNQMSGFDFSPLIVHPTRRGAYHQQKALLSPPEAALLQQIPRKYHPHSVNRAWRAVVTRDGWKYVCTPKNDWLLFDLRDDPFEQCNLCYDTAYQTKKEELHALLGQLIETTGDSFELPDIGLGGA